jgi:hypothetical protein
MNNQKLSQLLAEHQEEIKTALIKNEDVSILILLQQKLVFANEEELISFAGFISLLNYARVSSREDHRLKNVNVAAYMSLVDTAKARITLLSLFHRSDSELDLQLFTVLSI